jgi:hypothetical protein
MSYITLRRCPETTQFTASIAPWSRACLETHQIRFQFTVGPRRPINDVNGDVINGAN